jgi:hypothetical protein
MRLGYLYDKFEATAKVGVSNLLYEMVGILMWKRSALHVRSGRRGSRRRLGEAGNDIILMCTGNKEVTTAPLPLLIG